MNLNVNTFIGMSQLRNYWYTFDQYKTIDIFNAKKSAVMIYRSMTMKGCTISNFKLNGMRLLLILDVTLQMIFLMMMISIDNVELYLFKGILYCENLICVPWV